jgi:hypothetical protein
MDQATAADVGLMLAKMPGETLLTYFSSSTRTRVVQCEKAEGARLGGLAAASQQRNCRDFELRPLVWDFVNATLQWNGIPRKYTVGRIEEVSAQKRINRAQIAVSGRASTFAIYLAAEAGRLRLRLTDPSGKLYALSAPQAAEAEDFLGKWKAVERRMTLQSQIVVADSEKLELASDGAGRVVANHIFQHASLAPEGKSFTCNKRADVRDGFTQAFAGKYAGGVITAAPSREMTRLEPKDCPLPCGNYCSSYSADTAVLLKRVGEALFMYRTSGGMPEAQRFIRAVSPRTWS